MSQVPRELIRQVQICTRSASGLSDYNPSDPTLPALPPLSAAIAASSPSLPQSRCRNCKGSLLRGSESIICVYCGFGPHHDAVPDPISFTSTVAYQWLLSSLHLDGSEMVNPTNEVEENLGYNSPKTLTPLADFLHFKIPWIVEKEKPETTFPEKQPEQNEGSLRFTGLAPDTFFLKISKNAVSDLSNEQPFNHNRIGSDDGKDVAAVGYQDLSPNVPSPKPAGSSSEPRSSEDFSEWKADFQFADSENQNKYPGTLVDSKSTVEDPKPFDIPTNLGVNLGAQIDSMFGSGSNLNDGKPEGSPAVVSAFDDWNSDDVWNNMSSSTPHFDTVVGPKDGHTSLEYSKDTSADLFQDFELQTNYAEDADNKTTNEENTTVDEDLYEEWNDFTGSPCLESPSQNVWTGGDDYQVSTSDQKSPEIDFFSFDNKSEMGNFGSFSQSGLFSTSTSNNNNATIQVGDQLVSPSDQKSPKIDLFSFDNKSETGDLGSFSQSDIFSTSTSNNNATTQVDDQFFTSHLKSPEIDLFSFDNKSETGDIGGFSQPDLFSTLTSNDNATKQVNAIVSESPASDWLYDGSDPFHESGQSANDRGTPVNSTEDDVKMLISQMHDLSFMLETNLSIPSGPDTSNLS